MNVLPGKISDFITTLNRPSTAAELSLVCWFRRFEGSKVEPIPQNGPCGDNSLVALKLLSPDGDNAWSVMYKLSQALSDIEVPCSVLECEGEPCLFVNRQDEFAATCRLKNFGVAIAEPFSNYNPF
ncbi:YejG family protein [Escherichia coli]